MSFDEEPMGEHEECAHEIHRLEAEIERLRAEVEHWQQRCTKEHLDHDMLSANRKLLEERDAARAERDALRVEMARIARDGHRYHGDTLWIGPGETIHDRVGRVLGGLLPDAVDALAAREAEGEAVDALDALPALLEIQRSLVEWFNAQPDGWLNGLDEDRAYELVSHVIEIERRLAAFDTETEG